jgi:hypothetical protein
MEVHTKTNNNMKQLLIDYTPFKVAKLTLTEGKSTNGRMLLEGKLQEAEVKNGNGRRYPREILEREVEKYIKGPIANNNAMGELDHPEASIINLSNVSHNIKKVWWEGNDLMGRLELLNTPSGKIAMELVSAGIPLGISSRGMGSVKQIGETVEVQDDFELLCWDLVSVPSTPEAYMHPVGKLTTMNESKQYKSTKDYSKVNSLITEIICSQTGVCPLC